MYLNPSKCSFRVHGGMFLGFMLTKRGIKANLDKYQSVIAMRSPTNFKEMQRLTGCLATLSSFLSCASDKAFLFFTALKKKEIFESTAKYSEAFSKVNSILAFIPSLTLPREESTLLLYLSVTDQATNPVLVQETDKKERLVYS